MSTGHFFAVDRLTWAKVCDLGLGPAVAYLVLARGSGADQRTTAWSVDAIERHTGTARGRAKAAIQALETRRLLTRGEQGGRPRYRLRTLHDDEERASKNTDWIWLPNAMIDGASGERPPVRMIRERQDVNILRLFVDLYSAHHLRDDGGVDRSILDEKWSRVIVGSFGQYTVYGFANDYVMTVKGSVGWVAAHDRPELTRKERQAGVTVSDDFFKRIEALCDLGLVEWVPHLYDGTGPDAEIIHPCGLREDTLEWEVSRAAHDAALSMLTPFQRKAAEEHDPPLSLVPVPRHIVGASLIGIARLRYRPQTRATAAWWADYERNLTSYRDAYRRLEAQASTSMEVAWG